MFFTLRPLIFNFNPQCNVTVTYLVNVGPQLLAYNALAICTYNPQTSVTITCGIQPIDVVTMTMEMLHNTCNMCIHDLPDSVDMYDVSSGYVIKTHSSVSAAKKTKEDVRYTSVLFTGTVKLPNSAFCISKTTKQISTKFTYFLPYIYTTSHIKIEGNSFSSFRYICS